MLTEYYKGSFDRKLRDEIRALCYNLYKSGEAKTVRQEAVENFRKKKKKDRTVVKLKTRIILGFTASILMPLLLFAAALLWIQPVTGIKHRQ